MPHLWLKQDTIQQAMFVKYFIISYELHQEAALGRKANSLVLVVEIRKQDSVGNRGSHPSRHQPSSPGADFSFLVQIVCAHLAPDTYTRGHSQVQP